MTREAVAFLSFNFCYDRYVLRRMASTFLAKYLWALHISYWGPCACEHSSNAKPLWNFQLNELCQDVSRCLRHLCRAGSSPRMQDPKLCKALDVWQRPSCRKGSSGRACGSSTQQFIAKCFAAGSREFGPLHFIWGNGILWCPAGL